MLLEIVQARQINVRGVVQGIGFRPFVYLLACRNNLTGQVFNTSGDVTIIVEGRGGDIEKFLKELREEAPPQARIESIEIKEQPVSGYQHFEIRESLVKEDDYQLISPDLASCQACITEIFNPEDRRYRYPFTNCTHCGPRFTIIEDIPYDRPRTTMKKFRMCPACRKEYDSPNDRRFHAQPNACPVCGPELVLTDAQGKAIPTVDVIASAGRLLREGKILAVKGLGGFLLACNAADDAAVRALRKRKKRPHKPFAVMVKDLQQAGKYCGISPAEEQLLKSAASPIVLLVRRSTPGISREVAPGLKEIGIMLPYTPLHHLLLAEVDFPLVMTSGNLSEEPIARENGEALKRLTGIADFFIVHNRDIYSRYDDSVVRVVGEVPQIIRRARGYAPYPVYLTFSSRQVLACGADLKNTFCLTRGRHAFISQHIGDMENLETLEHFESTLQIYLRLFRIQPEVVACDMHPDYLSTHRAEDEARIRGIPLVPVQHHHAHVVSCLADNGVREPVIGVALDGTGYGTDGSIWGGEFLIADYRGFERAAHLQYLPLPGGDAAIVRPYRTATGYLYSLFGMQGRESRLNFMKDVDPLEIEMIKRQIDRGLAAPLTSSCGRLFDAVSAMLGIRGEISYEGQAATELEAIAEGGEKEGSYPFHIEPGKIKIVSLKEILAAIISDLEAGVPAPVISARFHNTIARLVSELCLQIASESGIKQVALSGGVFQNRLLFNLVVEQLKDCGLVPLFHHQVPCNDGGISLGQAVIANFSEERK